MATGRMDRGAEPDQFADYPAFDSAVSFEESSSVSVIDGDILEANSVGGGTPLERGSSSEQTRREIEAIDEGDLATATAGALTDEDTFQMGEEANLGLELAAAPRPETSDLSLGLSQPVFQRSESQEDMPEASDSSVVMLDSVAPQDAMPGFELAAQPSHDLSSDLIGEEDPAESETGERDARPSLSSNAPAPWDDVAETAVPDDAPLGRAANGTGDLAPFSHAPVQAEPEAPDLGLSEDEIQQINDELDEAEFLAQQGLEDEAREALEAVLVRVPKHPRALEIRATFDSSEIGMDFVHSSSVEQPANPLDEPIEEPEDASDVTAISDADFSGALESALGEDDGGGDENPEDHYDHGIAYKEVGRLDDAIAHFKVAAKSPGRAVAATEMIGHCLFAKQDYAGAINSFWSALELKPELEAATNLKYEIANAYEIAEDLQQAASWFRAVYAEDPNHRDVQDRLRSLGIDPDDDPSSPSGGGSPQNGAARATSDIGSSSSRKNKISYL